MMWVEGKPWSCSDIVREEELALETSVEEILTAETKRMELRDIAYEPLWRVTGMPVKTDSNGPAFLALSVNHALTDGKGMLNILEMLLSPIRTKEEEDIFNTKTMEDTAPPLPTSSCLPISCSQVWPNGTQ